MRMRIRTRVQSGEYIRSNSNIIQIQIMIRDKTTSKENFSPKKETHQEIPKSN